ncbi:MAG: MBL fold metallo-hydrolase [Gammaproteobacteria bacterium]|nr:MBL fold metallo-hydrolase [Gammaproteobacteria bacterium]
MNERKIGKLGIRRIVESVTAVDPLGYFPGTRDSDWAAHRAWLTETGAMHMSSGRLLLHIQSYLIRTTHHTILVDTCVGNHKQRPTRPQWHQRDDDRYLHALHAHDLSVEDIDYVVCTHLHADHIGWNTRLVDGRWQPTFPKARYLFSERELRDRQQAGEGDPGHHALQDSVLPVLEAGRAQLVNDDFELDDEVWLEPAPGHTTGHVMVRLRSNGVHAVMSGDLVHSPVQCAQPDWVTASEQDAELARRTRRAFLQSCSGTDILVLTAHFPLPSAGRLVSAGDGFRFLPDSPAW